MGRQVIKTEEGEYITIPDGENFCKNFFQLILPLTCRDNTKFHVFSFIGVKIKEVLFRRVSPMLRVMLVVIGTIPPIQSCTSTQREVMPHWGIR